jgi:isoquinoline 1-oxidoreductase subunit beta
MEINKTVSRRKFIKLTSVSGAFLALGFPISSIAGGTIIEAGLENLLRKFSNEIEINPFILIEESGKITIFSHKPEMGQGTWQSMPMIIAEELDVDPMSIHIQSTKGEKKFGSQGVGGSSSVRGSWDMLRKAGASAKEMLIKAASIQWKVPMEACHASEGRVYHTTSEKSLSYGELVAAASKLEVPNDPKLKDPSKYKWIGKSLPRQDIPLKTNGQAIYGIDQKIAGMLYASIERCPTIHGKIKSIDDTETKKVKGVRQVISSQRNIFRFKMVGVAVIADNYFSALDGRKKLKVEWDNEEAKKTDTDVFFNELKTLAKNEGAVHEKAPDFEKLFSKSKKKLVSQYETPFQAHSPMEPQTALVDVKENSCEVWASVQGPDAVRKTLSDFLKIPEDKIIVHTPFLGGSFGRKGFYDFIYEAAYLSKELKAPVKVIWTREDDISQGPFRPGMLSQMEGFLDEAGNISGMHHKVIAPSIQHQLWQGLKAGEPDMWPMGEISRGALPYKIPQYKTSYTLAETEIPLCWWRSVYSSTTFFGQESFIDEMAILARKDPMQYRLDMMKDEPRFYNLLQSLKEKSGWDKPLAKGKGKGVALVKSFGSIVANVVFVGKAGSGKMRIEKVVSMIDCGLSINPDNIKAQIEGSIVMAITAAIKEPITFKEGRTQQSNFHNYSMLRMNEVPEIEVHVVDSKENPTGVGEPGVPPVAPALTNAIFNATKNRIKKLPFNLHEV